MVDLVEVGAGKYMAPVPPPPHHSVNMCSHTLHPTAYPFGSQTKSLDLVFPTPLI